MKKNKLLSMTIAVLTGATLFAGCGSKTESATSSSANGKVDTSKEVKLTMYLLGAAPAGMPDVTAELNKKLKKDINATIDINYIGWGDLQSKYPLVLASGDDVDMIYTASWAYYQQEAVKGAFREVTQDDLKTYLPKVYNAVDKNAYNQLNVNGKNYMIPTSSPDRKVPVALIRGDLRKKYNIPEIKTFDQIEPYLEAIKKNEPDMIPLNLDSQYDIGQPFAALERAYGFNGMAITTGVWADMTDQSGKIADRYTLNSGDQFKKSADKMKEWYDKGYVNKNPFANKVRSSDSITQGKSGVAFGNTVDIQSVLAKAKDSGQQLEIIPLLTTSGKYMADSYLNNGMAIAANSKNPERAMMALDLIMQDPSYDMLVYFGIEGKNYAITSDGKIGLPAGVTADKNTYPPDAAGFWFTNKDLFKPLASWSDEYIKHKEAAKAALVNWVYSPFAFDPSSVKTEMANLSQVEIQYGNPIYVGSVKNVDEAIKTYQQKYKDAGFQKVFDETKKQTEKFLSQSKK